MRASKKRNIILDMANIRRNTSVVLRETGGGDCNHDSYGLSESCFQSKQGSAWPQDRSHTHLFPDAPAIRGSGPDALLPPGSVPERVGIARLAFSSPCVPVIVAGNSFSASDSRLPHQ